MAIGKSAVGETRERLRIIRKLARLFPPATASDRMKEIADIASGGDIAMRVKRSVTPEESAADMASRSPRMNHPEPTVVSRKSRTEKKSRDRKEKGGRDREEE